MDKIGPYEILETLHLGPQPLYRAKAADGRIVAVKTIPVKGLSAEMRERFVRVGFVNHRGHDHKAIDAASFGRLDIAARAGDVLAQRARLAAGFFEALDHLARFSFP